MGEDSECVGLSGGDVVVELGEFEFPGLACRSRDEHLKRSDAHNPAFRLP